jgi:hypothetical protein
MCTAIRRSSAAPGTQPTRSRCRGSTRCSRCSPSPGSPRAGPGPCDPASGPPVGDGPHTPSRCPDLVAASWAGCRSGTPPFVRRVEAPTRTPSRAPAAPGVRPPAGPRRCAPGKKGGPGSGTAKRSAPLAVSRKQGRLLAGRAGFRDARRRRNADVAAAPHLAPDVTRAEQYDGGCG